MLRIPPTPTLPRKQSPDDINQQVLAAFRMEHKEHLEGIRALLMAVQKKGQRDDLADSSAELEEIFRLAHSLKGGARVVELPVVEGLGHRLETLCSRVRDGSLRLDADIIAVIHQVLNAIEDWMTNLGENQLLPSASPADALAAVERLLSGGGRQDAEDEKVPASGSSPAVRQPTTRSDETVRVSAESLDRLLRSSAELLTEGVRQDQLTGELGELARQILEMEQEGKFFRKASAVRLRRLAVLPEFARILRYLEQVEHKVRSLARQARAVQMLQRRSSWAFRLLGEQVQRDVQRARMVPAESIFQGFRKMMRDLARDEGKEIEFQMSGLDVQADRVVLQALKDPVMHLLRNAVSHGIELPEERQQRGKPQQGQVTLRAEALGNRFRLSIEDDGRGIDFPRVVEVGVQRGLLRPTLSAGLAKVPAGSESSEELSGLLFQPGFSTSRVVTELSGRGMGLSVVAETVKRLQGEVRLRPSGTGTGASVVISVPLSVCTQRLLLIACAGQTFAMPLHSIERLLRVVVRDVETVEGRPMIALPSSGASSNPHARLIPLVSLALLLGLREPEPTPGETLAVIVLRSDKTRLAVVVDAILAEREGLIKDLDGPAARVAALAKVAVRDPSGRWFGRADAQPSRVARRLRQPVGRPGQSGWPAPLLNRSARCVGRATPPCSPDAGDPNGSGR